MDLGYFQYAFEQVIKHKKSAIIWFRQSGKSKFLEDFVVEYCKKFNNKKILILSSRKYCSKNCYLNLSNKLNCTYKNDDDMSLQKDSNLILFKSYNRIDEKYRNEKVDFLLIDDFLYLTDRSFNILYNLLQTSERVLLSMGGVSEHFHTLDSNDDYYLNVVQMKSVMSKSEIDSLNIPTIFGLSFFDVNDIIGVYNEVFHLKKREHMIDYYSIQKSRTIKLKKIQKSIK